MEITFAQFCHDAALCAAMRQQIDACGARGLGYEFSLCRMPEGCAPERVCVGFFHRTDGSYMMYWKPAVIYRGKSAALDQLFRQCLWRFNSYAELTAKLRALRWDLPMPQTMGSRSGAAAALVPQKKVSFVPPRKSAAPPEDAWPAGFSALRQTLREQIFGQDEAVDAAAFQLCGHVGKIAPARPLSLIFHGPTGVGKSELAKALPDALARCGQGGWQMVWTELNTFTQPHSVHRLIGAPPGYVGYEDAPVFAAVDRNPRTVFLFDELDKAHPDVLKVFMSILDEGRCTANRANAAGGRELDFRRCVFVFTTNMDLTAARRAPGFSTALPPQTAQKKTAASPEELAKRLFLQNELARSALIQQGVLREIAGRFSGLIGFQPLRRDAWLQILRKQAISLGREYGLQITDVTPEAAQLLLPRGEAVSVRSAICMLDARLSPLYQQAVSTGGMVPRQLTADSGALALSVSSALSSGVSGRTAAG